MSLKFPKFQFEAVYRWRHRHPILWHFLLGLAFGIGVELLLHESRTHVPVLTEMETAAADSMMRFWVQRDPDPGPSDLEKPYYPFAWINIDQETYESWKEPLTIPREQLWRILARVIEAGPTLVIVDVALDRSLHQSGDELLKHCLKLYSDRAWPMPADCFSPRGRSDGRRWPHILFPASLKKLAEESRGRVILMKERPSDFLEEVVRGSQVLHWASTTFERDQDYVVRKWRLFEVVTREHEETMRVMPSVALLSWAILRAPSLEGKQFDVDRFEHCVTRVLAASRSRTATLSSEDCSGGATLPQGGSYSETRSELVCSSEGRATSWPLWDPVLRKSLCLSLNPSDVQQRVIYPLGDVRRACPNKGNVPSQPWSPAYIKFHGQQQPLVECFSALDLLSGSVLPQVLEDRVVVIGTSYEDSRDFHATPLGRMPGSVWIMNAVQALMQYGQLEELHGLGKWLLVCGFIVGFAYLFAKLTSLAGALMSALVIAVVFVPFSLWLFKVGTWLDFSLPVVGVACHHVFSNVLDRRFVFFRESHDHEG